MLMLVNGFTVSFLPFPSFVCLALSVFNPSCLSRGIKICEHNAVAYPSQIFMLIP